jgi:plastocyanin
MSNSLFLNARCIWIAAILFLGLSSHTITAQQFVAITSSGFVPNQVTINVGDSILWFNSDSNSVHTTTSDKPPGDPDYWNRSLNYFEFYTRTFTHAGNFTYHDSLSSFTGTIIVNPAGPKLELPRVVNGQFLFNATGLIAGKTNVVFASTNLTSWTAIQTNVATGSSMTFTNAANLALRFYRLQEMR